MNLDKSFDMDMGLLATKLTFCLVSFQVYLLREPLLVIAAFMILFATVLIYVRLDFSITSSKVTKSDANSSVVESVLKRHGKRANVYDSFDNHIKKFKATKDLASFQTHLKNFTADHKTETQAINDIAVKCKSDAPELSER